MSGREDSKRPGPGVPAAQDRSPAGEDVLGQGGRQLPVPRWRPPLIAVVLRAAGLLIGLVAGYAAGDRHARASSPRPAHSPAAPLAGALTQAAGRCSAQAGHELQLGLEITNESAEGVTLVRVRALLPLGGLTVVSQAWGPCGQLPAPASSPGSALSAAASTWFTVTFRVLVKCPAPLPVRFAVDYDQLGRPAMIRLPGFADLGDVPYPGGAAASP